MGNNKFEELFNKYLANSNFSQAELARQLNKKDRSTVRKWIEGINKPSIEDLYRLSSLFKLSEDEKINFFKAAGREEYVNLANLESQISPSSPDILQSTFSQHHHIKTDTGGQVTGQGISLSFRSIPLQRPLRVLYFRGREAEIAQILQALQPGRIVTLCGPGGIGKSAIAAEVVHELAPDDKPPELFPDGIIFHSFPTQPQVDQLFERIIELFGKKRDKVSARDTATGILSELQALIVLDAVEHADNLEKFLEVCGNCGVLMTSRHRHVSEEVMINIETLPDTIARDVLQAWSKGKINDPKVTDQICRLLGYLPLALRIAGSYVYQRELRAFEYLEVLTATPLLALHLESQPHASVEILLKQSVQMLSEPAQKVLGLAGLLAPFSISQVFLVYALGVSEAEANRLLGELINYSLVLRINEYNYQTTHLLVGHYAREHLLPSVSNEVIQRLWGCFYILIHSTSEDGLDAYHDLEYMLAISSKLINECISRKEWVMAETMAWIVNEFLTLRNLPINLPGYDIENIHDVGLKIAKYRDDQQSRSVWLTSQGRIFEHNGMSQRALRNYKEALWLLTNHKKGKVVAQYWAKINEVEINSFLHKSLKQSLGFLKILFRPLVHLLARIEWTKLLPYERVEGLSKGVLDYINRIFLNIIVVTNQYMIKFARKIGAHKLAITCLTELVDTYYALHQFQIANDYAQQALDISRDKDEFEHEIILLDRLGLIHEACSDVETALNYYKQALITLIIFESPQLDSWAADRLERIFNEDDETNELAG